ncbi:sodium/potassium-transporting ATPase subunit alpha [Pancytospora epiphaga]|nr:sodium/potassium-transporting ATPase subunit alpha [Pancytospora epiphaga]
MKTKCKDQNLDTDKLPAMWEHVFTAEGVPVGLSEVEARRRFKALSERIVNDKEPGIQKMIISIVKEPINLLMISASITSAIIYAISREEKEHITACIFTFSILFISMIIEIYHQLNLKRLSRSNTPTYYCNAYRGGILKRTRKEEVVEGDLLKIAKGDRMWVDCYLVKAKEIRVDESGMGGSRAPVSKGASNLSDNHENIQSMLFESNIILSGTGLAIVLKTGRDTFLSRTYANDIPGCDTSRKHFLSNDIEVFFNASLLVATVLSLILLVSGVFLAITPIQLAGVIVSVYISILPEGIPALIKLLSYTAALKLRSRKVLVSDMDVVQKLAEVTIMCISKDTLIVEGCLLCEMIYNGEKMIGIDSAFYDCNEKDLEYLSAIAGIWLLLGKHTCGPLEGDTLSGEPADNEKACYDTFNAPSRYGTKGRSRRARGSKHKGKDNASSRVIMGHNSQKNAEIGRAARLFGEICHMYFGLEAPDIGKSRIVVVNGHYSVLFDNGKYNTLYVFGSPSTLLDCCSSRIKDGRFERLKKTEKKRMGKYLKLFEDAGYTLVGVAKATLSKKTEDFGRRKLTFLSYMCMKEAVKGDAPMTLNLLHSGGISNCIVHGGSEAAVRSVSDKLLESLDYLCEEDGALKNQHEGEELANDHLDYFPGEHNLEGEHLSRDRNTEERIVRQVEGRKKEPIRSRFITKRSAGSSAGDDEEIDYVEGFWDAGIGKIKCHRPGDHLLADFIESGSLPRSFMLSSADKSERAEFVDRLRRSGQVVAYFGANASDKEAMMRADVAIAAENAPEICKNAASMLLPADSIIGVIYSMEEGRLFYVNLQKAIKYVMMHISPQIFALLIFVFLGTPLPISPILLFFLDYLVEVIPAMFFAYENPEYNLITSGPKCLCTNRHAVAQGARAESSGLRDYIAGYAAQLRRVVGNGTLYSTELLQSSILITGMISALSCTLGFFAALMICGIPFSKCFFVSHEYFRYHSPPLSIGNGQVLGSTEQLYILYRAQSTFFIGILICQTCNIIMCRRSASYISARFFDNISLFVAFVIGMVLTIACVYSRWFEDFLLVRRPVISGLVAPLCGGILILLLDTYKKLRAQLYK